MDSFDVVYVVLIGRAVRDPVEETREFSQEELGDLWEENNGASCEDEAGELWEKGNGMWRDEEDRSPEKQRKRKIENNRRLVIDRPSRFG